MAVEIDFNTINIKKTQNYNADYIRHIVQQETISFLQDYEHSINESDFSRLFTYHVEKTRKELLERIVVYYKKAEQKSKKLTIEHLLQQILDSITEKNKDNWLKMHCISMLKAFDLLVKKINNTIKDIPENDLFKSPFISANTMHLRKLIIDAEEFLMWLEEYKGGTPKKKISFCRAVKGFDSNWFAALLFNGIVDTSNFAFFVSLAFLLRDSLELRVRNALGIINISRLDGTLAKITNGDFVDFLFENENIVVPNLNKALIKKIFEWCNYHIHRGIVLYEWQLVLSYEYIQDFFKPGKASSQMSIFGSVQMTEDYYKNQLKNDLKKFLVDKNPDNEEIKITLLDKPEALLMQ